MITKAIVYGQAAGNTAELSLYKYRVWIPLFWGATERPP